MGICGLKLEKEFLSLLQQYVRISGVKSKNDIAKMLSKSHWQSKCEADTCSNEFVNVLARIRELNKNPKDYLDLSCNIYDKTLKLLKANKCLNKSLSLNISKVTSINCCKLISSIARLKKILKYSYSIIKTKKCFYFFHYTRISSTYLLSIVCYRLMTTGLNIESFLLFLLKKCLI